MRLKNPESYVPDDLDKAILAILPRVGEKRGKYLPKSATSAEVKKALDDSVVNTTTIGARLGMLADAGYVVRVTGARIVGWQRTDQGDVAIK